MRKIQSCCLVLAALLLVGCEPGPDAPGPSEPWAEEAAGPVATVRGEPIAPEELDAPLRLRLHDLAESRYRLRRDRLHQLVAEQLAAQGVKGDAIADAVAAGDVVIHLEPPSPPRFPIDSSTAPRRGSPEAPVRVVVFCDFESAHCRRLQPTLRKLLDAYPGRVSIAARDHPLPFHSYARLAAQAARCAGEQGSYWQYHDAVYAEEGDLSRATLDRLARDVDLDASAFRECLDSGRMRAGVEADAGAAQGLGLLTVPVSFVNGLYVRGARSLAEFARLVDSELALPAAAGGKPMLHATAEPEAPPPSDTLPLVLRGTLVRDGRRSFATIERTDVGRSKVYAPGDEILDGVTLERIERRRVHLRRRDGEVEELPLALERAPLSQEREASASPAPVVAERTPAPDEESPGPPETAVVRADDSGSPSADRVRVSRADVDAALESRAALEEQLEPSDLDVEDGALLEIAEVGEGSLYGWLGLQPGDVILQVNGLVAHTGYNPLWDELESGTRISLTVMRDGIPRQLEIEIE
jgi:protein-disulfide isomerase/type II secretory pathway component PulC